MLCDTPVVSEAASTGVIGSIKSTVAGGGVEVRGKAHSSIPQKRLKAGKSSVFQGRPNNVV